MKTVAWCGINGGYILRSGCAQPYTSVSFGHLAVAQGVSFPFESLICPFKAVFVAQWIVSQASTTTVLDTKLNSSDNNTTHYGIYANISIQPCTAGFMKALIFIMQCARVTQNYEQSNVLTMHNKNHIASNQQISRAAPKQRPSSLP